MARTSISAQENYLNQLMQSYDFPEARTARSESDQLNKTMISLSIAEAQIVSVFLAGRNITKAVEVGTLTGHSGLFILKALAPSGTLWTLEKDPVHAEKAKSVLDAFAKSTNKNVHVVVGDAEQTLNVIEANGPFDAIFIDGNKSAYGEYLIWAQKNIRSGGIILADNVFLRGGVYGDEDMPFSEKQIRVLQEFNRTLANPKHFESCLVPTNEGLFVAIKK